MVAVLNKAIRRSASVGPAMTLVYKSHEVAAEQREEVPSGTSNLFGMVWYFVSVSCCVALLWVSSGGKIDEVSACSQSCRSVMDTHFS